MGRGQVVKAAGFDPATAGSTPAAPAKIMAHCRVIAFLAKGYIQLIPVELESSQNPARGDVAEHNYE